MSLKAFVSRSLAVQSCITTGVAFALVCNFAYGRQMIGYDLPSSVFVGAIVGGLIACAIGLVDFMTLYAGRTKDFTMFALMGIVAGNTVYNWNVLAHMNTSGWTVRGMLLATAIGFLCGSAYTFSCWAVKKITFENI